MGKLRHEYLVENERYSVEISASVILGRVSVKINDDKFVMSSAPFCIKRSEPFKIGEKRCMLNVSRLGKISID